MSMYFLEYIEYRCWSRCNTSNSFKEQFACFVISYVEKLPVNQKNIIDFLICRKNQRVAEKTY